MSDGLPFKVGHIQDALMKLVHSSGVSVDSVIPEAYPFAISDSLGQSPHGSSMNIAGLLAVIDAWNEYQGVDEDPLRCACSLVKPRGKENFNRHIGNFQEAVKYSREAVAMLEAIGDDASFQEAVEAKSRLGSAMYDSHQFPEAIEILNELIHEAQANPRLLNAESRVMLFNTYARLLVAADADGWETLYRDSIRLQEAVEPSSVGRTRCYLIHGLLRNKRTADAQLELCWFDENTTDLCTASFVRYYRADLYRRNPCCGSEFRQDDRFECSWNWQISHRTNVQSGKKSRTSSTRIRPENSANGTASLSKNALETTNCY